MNEHQSQQPPYPSQQYVAGPYAYGPPTTYGYRNGIATAALVTGIVGACLFYVPFVAWILGGLAFVFGLVGYAKVRGGASDAKGRAVAGIVLGAVTLALGSFMFVAYYQAADDYDRYSYCIDHTRLANWDRCDQYLD